jgi:hypothetical protein
LRYPCVCVRSAGTAGPGLVDVVVVVGSAMVVVVAGGAVVGAVLAAPTSACVESSDRAEPVPSLVGLGGVVVVVVVVDARAAAPEDAPASLVRAGRLESLAAPPAVRPCRGGREVLPEVSTRIAISASDTARITHQLGRPRATHERNPSVASAPPPTTGTPYARATPTALGG